MIVRLAITGLLLTLLPQDPVPYVAGRTLTGFGDQVTAVRFMKDGKHLVTGCWDGKVRIWGVDTWKETHALDFPGSQIMDVAASPDGSLLAIVGSRELFRIHETRKWTEVRRFSPPPRKDEDPDDEPADPAEWEYFSAAWAPDSRHVATGNMTKLAQLWDSKSGKQIRTFTGHTFFVLSVAFAPDGKTLVSGSTDGTTRVWNLESGKQVHAIKEEKDGHPMRVVFSADGKLCAVGMTTGLVKIFDAKTWKVAQSLPGIGISALAFSADGKLLAGAAANRSINLVDTATWKSVATLPGHTGEVTSAAFSPDGKYLATGASDKEVRVWDRKP